MKQIFVTLVFLLGMICSLPAQNNPKALPGTQPSSAMVVSGTIDSTYEARIDSIVQAKVNKQVNKEVNKQVSKEMKKWKQRYGIGKKDFPFDISAKAQVMGIIATILGFAFPLLIIGMILYYRYKNKKERYEVMKQALAHGKNLPPEFCNNEIIAPTPNSSNDLLWRKGIKTFFLGLGLALFLGMLTSRELSSIGLLIMCIGGGEIILGWFPSASQIKNRCHKYRKEEKLWDEQPDSSCHNAAPQPETRQAAQNHPSDNTPQQEVTAAEGVDKNDETEVNLPETKDNMNAGENELSRTDNEEIKG